MVIEMLQVSLSLIGFHSIRTFVFSLSGVVTALDLELGRLLGS